MARWPQGGSKDLWRAGGLLALIALPVVWSGCGPGAPEAGEEKTAEVSPAEGPETVAEIDDPWLRPGRAHEWTGDLDGMVERGVVRVLTTANRTDFFVDGKSDQGEETTRSQEIPGASLRPPYHRSPFPESRPASLTSKKASRPCSR